MKINESKQIRMKTNWMKTEIKVDLTKSFSNWQIVPVGIENFNFERKVCEILTSPKIIDYLIVLAKLLNLDFKSNICIFVLFQ